MNTMIKVLAIVQLLLTSHIPLVATASDNPPIANTQQGVYTGQQTTIDGTNINYWYGIPYAQQPTGGLRWMPPQPLAASNGTTEAYVPNACPQMDNVGVPMTESCLSLNVYAPATTSNMPVFVWIHGGSFTSGAGVYYNAAPFVSTSVLNSVPVVVVTINYRLGLLGFLADNGLYAEKSGMNNRSTTGNYGILDQIMALDWLKKNIAGFGGNPNKITIGGESAGGLSVIGLLTSSLVPSGAFHRAIVQSGALWDSNNITLQNAISSTGDFLRTNVACSTVQCLRNTTVAQILAAQRILGSQNIFGSSASPISDGYVFDGKWEDYFARGTFQKVPLLIGSNTNETSLFTCPYFNQAANISQVQAFLVQMYGSAIANAIPNVYGSITSYANPLAYLNTVFSDSWLHCGSRRAVSTLSSYGLPAYLYTYNHVFSVTPPCLGAAHAAELPMIFPSILAGLYPNYNLSTAEQQLSKSMMLYWASFINNADPNYNGASAKWAPYSSATDGDFVIDVSSSMRYFYYNGTCSRLWDRNGSVNTASTIAFSWSVALVVMTFRFLLI